MNRNWRIKTFKKLEPKAFITKIQNDQRYMHLSPEGQSHHESQTGWSGVFYQQINEGFWLFCIETEASRNTCYQFQPKSTEEQYYSINYFITGGKLGYEIEGFLKWNNSVVVFSNPFSSYNIYLKKGMSLKGHRLVFTKDYLMKLIHINRENLSHLDLWKTINGKHPVYIRNVEDPENVILRRIHFLEKHGQEHFDHELSIIKTAYEIAETFFRLSLPKPQQGYTMPHNSQMLDRAAIILERHIQDKFPGIAVLAEKCHASPTKLKSHFKKTYQTTPLEYFRNLQMAYAYDVLQKKELSIKDISLLLCFKKTSTFTFWFKKTIGKNPSEI